MSDPAAAMPPLDLVASEIITRLGPHVQPRRLARLRAVAAQRTRHLGAVCERFFDLHNVAACLRTADALGLQEVHVVPEPVAPGVPRRPPRDLTLAAELAPPEDPTDPGRSVSMASERWVDRVDHPTLADAVAALRARGHRVVVTALGDTGAITPVDALPLDRPLSVIWGNEQRGVSAEALALADLRVAIPMRGFVPSLNVSVAFAIVMSRLRDRLEAERPPDRWALTPDEQDALVARWLFSHVPHAPRILGRGA